MICGHIHQPEIKKLSNEKGEVLYLNSGDWVENLTALEYNDKTWSLYKYQEDPIAKMYDVDTEIEVEPKNSELFESMLSEFTQLPA